MREYGYVKVGIVDLTKLCGCSHPSQSLTRCRRLHLVRQRCESNGCIKVWVADLIKLCASAEPLRALSDPLNVNIDLVHCTRLDREFGELHCDRGLRRGCHYNPWREPDVGRAARKERVVSGAS